jgi:hypothetical protein
MSWVGVDFDGTLAQYEEWRGPTELGEPILPMIQRVRRWLDDGIEVRIVTARANLDESVKAIGLWSIKYLGQPLVVTDQKDFAMIEIWDDRAVTVERNTGRQLTPSLLDEK